MGQAFWRAWEDLFGRIDGPMSFRLIIQPVVATFLAIRAGWADAREGRPIFFWTLARHPAQTQVMLRNLWRISGKVFLVAVVLDAIYQIIVFHWFYPLQALIVATLLALVPCMLARAVRKSHCEHGSPEAVRGEKEHVAYRLDRRQRQARDHSSLRQLDATS
jgi:hypothetical protein